jgi:hypothetical protein
MIQNPLPTRLNFSDIDREYQWINAGQAGSAALTYLVKHPNIVAKEAQIAGILPNIPSLEDHGVDVPDLIQRYGLFCWRMLRGELTRRW